MQGTKEGRRSTFVERMGENIEEGTRIGRDFKGTDSQARKQGIDAYQSRTSKWWLLVLFQVYTG